jgi:hypothetical protein
MDWNDQNAFCMSGDVASLLPHIVAESDPQERGILYTSSIYQMIQAHQEIAAIEMGRLYVDEFRREPNPFGVEQPLEGRVAAIIIKLLHYSGSTEEAIELCEFVLSRGISDDGTKSGLAGRLARLKKFL